MSARIALRPLTAADREAFVAAARASRHLHRPWVTAPCDAAAFDRHLARFDGRQDHGFVVVQASTGALAGAISLTHVVHGALCSGYLGYYAFAGFERQGLMAAGLAALARHAFRSLGLHRLEANIQPANAASIALVRRCGFEREGCSPGYLKIGGRWRDHERWALRRPSGAGGRLPRGAPARAVTPAPAPLIRDARPDDALCLGVLGLQVFLDTYAGAGIRPTVAREVLGTFATETMAAQLQDPDTRFLVAEQDGHLVGFAQVTLGAVHDLAPPGPAAELLRLYVQEPFTGAGLGTRLLRAAEAVAAARGARVLWLTPWVHNRRALAFYAARGYADHGQTWYRFEGEAHRNRLLARRLQRPADGGSGGPGGAG